MEILKTEVLCKQHTAAMALKKLNQSIQQGEVYCLLWRNTTNKATSINLFLGFIQASAGKIFVNDTEVKISHNLPQQFITYIPELVQFYYHLSGIENLDYFSGIVEKKYTIVQLSRFLTEAGLQKSVHNKPLNTYSKPMLQKVAIAIALAKNAKVIFIDEPINELNPMILGEFSKMVATLKQHGKTAFMATHDIFNALNIAGNLSIKRSTELVQQINLKNIMAVRLQKLHLENI